MSSEEPVRVSPLGEDAAWLSAALQGTFAIEDITTGMQPGNAIRLRGRFLTDTESAYERLSIAAHDHDRRVLFRHERQEVYIIIQDQLVHPKPNNIWLPIVLAVATLISVFVSHSSVLFNGQPFDLRTFLSDADAWIFTGTLLAILLTHEFGHYFMARRLGIAVSLPYLIPFPFSAFGTMGAVISMKDVPPSKRGLLLMGASGPIAGLIVALPLLILGLRMSSVAPLPTSGAYTLEGNSLLYLGIKYLILGEWLPSAGRDVLLHPMAYAAWVGLLVTALNLIPAAQLDGGHVASALLGNKARYLNYAIIAVLLIMGIWWQGWLLWAVIIFLFSRFKVLPNDDVTPLQPREVVLAVVLLVLFVLTFTPIPIQIIGM